MFKMARFHFHKGDKSVSWGLFFLRYFSKSSNLNTLLLLKETNTANQWVLEIHDQQSCSEMNEKKWNHEQVTELQQAPLYSSSSILGCSAAGGAPAGANPLWKETRQSGSDRAAMLSCGLTREQEAQSPSFTTRNLHMALSIASVLNTEHTLFGFQSIKL